MISQSGACGRHRIQGQRAANGGERCVGQALQVVVGGAMAQRRTPARSRCMA